MTWSIRETLAYRRPIRQVAPVDLRSLLKGVEDPESARLRVDTLIAPLGVDLATLSAEASWVLDALDIVAATDLALQHLPGPLPDPLRVADIGAKTWHYVRGLEALLRKGYGGPREVLLTGLEIDAFRVYRDFHSRWDWATWHRAPCPSARYLAMDALHFNEPQDLVFLLLPIMNVDEHLDWGLPLERYQPEVLFSHARRLAGRDGHVVMLNFAYEEPALDILAEAHAAALLLRVPAPSALVPAHLPRVLTLWRGLAQS